MLTEVPRQICSVGYLGFTQQTFIERMRAEGVETVVDVRMNAVSRKPGFSKRGLGGALAAAGIDYIHEPGLGNPQDNRRAFHREDRSHGRARMREILEREGREPLLRVADLAVERPIAILCVEREHCQCHRAVIAEALSNLRPALTIKVIT